MSDFIQSKPAMEFKTGTIQGNLHDLSRHLNESLEAFPNWRLVAAEVTGHYVNFILTRERTA